MAEATPGTMSDDVIKQYAFAVPKALPGKCKWCPRSFEKGEKIVFFTTLSVQSKMMGPDIMTGTPASFGEIHSMSINNAHLDCAIKNKILIRTMVQADKPPTHLFNDQNMSAVKKLLERARMRRKK